MVRLPILLLAMASLAGCGRTALEAAQDLGAAKVSTRRSAADDIEDEVEETGSLPREVVDALLYRAAVETDFETREDVIEALAYSGDVRAKEVLDAYARTDLPEQREAASEALQIWSVKTGRFPADYRFPANWPYGTEAYPELPKQAATSK